MLKHNLRSVWLYLFVVHSAFLTSDDVSVIVVDWSTYAGQRYNNAVNAVPSVGVALAEFIQILVGMNQVSLDRLHLVGFDLGAHVIGFTGRTLSGQVARITGMYYHNLTSSCQIHKTIDVWKSIWKQYLYKNLKQLKVWTQQAVNGAAILNASGHQMPVMLK